MIIALLMFPFCSLLTQSKCGKPVGISVDNTTDEISPDDHFKCLLFEVTFSLQTT